MAFTVQEIANAANAALDFYLSKGKVFSQSIQERPTLDKLMANKKTFPGGKENISVGVKGDYTTTIQGFEHDDTVTYANPANIKRANYPWKLIHSGIQITMHELAKDGISVVDSTTGKSTSEHSQREQTALANLLEDKLEDMAEGSRRGFNLMFWRDGTQDAKLVPGIRSIIVNDPTAATLVGGIDQSVSTWWRNRATLGIDSSTASNQNLINELQVEWRQLRRYGGKINYVPAGSDFLEAFEKELRSKGNYTLEGFNKTSATDPGMADLAFKGVPFVYDPTLDDEGLAKYAFPMDTRVLFPMVMEGEDMKSHAPARPENKYVFYRAVTWIGGLVCRQRNALGVYSIA